MLGPAQIKKYRHARDVYTSKAKRGQGLADQIGALAEQNPQ